MLSRNVRNGHQFASVNCTHTWYGYNGTTPVYRWLLRGHVVSSAWTTSRSYGIAHISAYGAAHLPLGIGRSPVHNNNEDTTQTDGSGEPSAEEGRDGCASSQEIGTSEGSSEAPEVEGTTHSAAPATPALELKSAPDQEMCLAAPTPWSLIYSAKHHDDNKAAQYEHVQDVCSQYLCKHAKDRHGLLKFIAASIDKGVSASIDVAANTTRASMRAIRNCKTEIVAAKITEKHTFTVKSAGSDIGALAADMKYIVRPTPQPCKYKICDLEVTIRHSDGAELTYTSTNISEVPSSGAQNTVPAQSVDDVDDNAQSVTPDADLATPSDDTYSQSAEFTTTQDVDVAPDAENADTQQTRNSFISPPEAAPSDEIDVPKDRYVTALAASMRTVREVIISLCNNTQHSADPSEDVLGSDAIPNCTTVRISPKLVAKAYGEFIREMLNDPAIVGDNTPNAAEQEKIDDIHNHAQYIVTTVIEAAQGATGVHENDIAQTVRQKILAELAPDIPTTDAMIEPVQDEHVDITPDSEEQETMYENGKTHPDRSLPTEPVFTMPFWSAAMFFASAMMGICDLLQQEYEIELITNVEISRLVANLLASSRKDNNVAISEARIREVFTACQQEISEKFLSCTGQEFECDSRFIQQMTSIVLKVVESYNGVSLTDWSVTDKLKQKAAKLFVRYHADLFEGIQPNEGPEPLQLGQQLGNCNAAEAALLWSGTEFKLANDVTAILGDTPWVKHLFFAQPKSNCGLAEHLILGIIKRITERSSLAGSDFKIEGKISSRSRLRKGGSYHVTHKATVAHIHSHEEIGVYLSYTVHPSKSANRPKYRITNPKLSVLGTDPEQVACFKIENMASKDSLPFTDAEAMYNKTREKRSQHKHGDLQTQQAPTKEKHQKILVGICAALKAILCAIWKFITYPFTLLASCLSFKRHGSQTTSDNVAVTTENLAHRHPQAHSSSRGNHRRARHKAQSSREEQRIQVRHSRPDRKADIDDAPTTVMSNIEVNSLSIPMARGTF
ncbi:hypothetical protein AM368 [Anaplasma marginale str. St. Maries]|nr:hypothetical protein AM368 [Anaplasma marginale str. St. Maries]